jgi:hypothetical protein
MPIIFGDRKKMAAMASGGKPLEVETDDDMKILQALAQDIIDASKSGSASDLARALKSFFLQCDSEPHEEGPHE